MPRGPRGEQRPSDVVGCAVKVMQLATGEETEELQPSPDQATTDAKRAAGRKGGAARAHSLQPAERAKIASEGASARWHQDNDQEVAMASRILDPINNEADRSILEEGFARHRADTDYVESHKAEWQVAYPDKWILVHKGELVAVADTMDDAFDAVEKKGIAPAETVWAYLATEPRTFILPSDGTCP